ncbi:hypothetical protein QSV08_14055 [Maribacter sp. BPC-D8]|uniref:hypothetical protein n=1 Tax=Maribacter sp. BPC-D8 TaxID=3053613 RepID=UPI002B48736E|nr:hypothetical protein [Maribacter sp. BPC-D8]WRI28343.1 hypothetical protein QSV08_14055 [Maribacter sp. BPC-D8]
MEMFFSLRNVFLVLIAVLWSNLAYTQIKIGDNLQNLNSSSLLELESSTKVFVINRMNTTQMELLIPLEGAIVYNTDIKCLHYFNGTNWNNLCHDSNNSSLSITDNGNGTFTVDNGENLPFSFDGASESITTLGSNGDNTYTYVNELGVETIIDLNISQTTLLSTLENNGDGTYTYTDEEGNLTIIDLNGSQSSIISTLVNNGDGTYTYTDEIDNQTTIDLNNNQSSVISTLVDNGDDTYTYTDEQDIETTFDLSNNQSTVVSTLTDNGDGTYTYTDEENTPTTFFVGNINGRHFGDAGSIFFANDTTGDPTQDNNNLFWDNQNKRLGVGVSAPLSTLHVNGTTRTNRINNGIGTASFPGYHFSVAFNSGMFALLSGEVGFSVSGNELMRLGQNQRVGINVQAPQATLHVGGNLIVDGTITTSSGTYKNNAESNVNTIRKLIKKKEAVSIVDNTLIITSTVEQLVMPSALASNLGHIFMFKNLKNIPVRINLQYVDMKGNKLSFIPNNDVIWLQSDGSEWQQIN